MTKIWRGSGENDGDREKGLKQKLLEMENAIKDIFTSNLSGERSAR
jgi:hypothetical protein